ncbi:MAG: hypothetical protein RMY28_025930 [Nostoc sp. ChiSLP01]
MSVSFKLDKTWRSHFITGCQNSMLEYSKDMSDYSRFASAPQ